MASKQQISEVLLRYDLDERSVSDSLKAADAVLQRFKKLQTQADQLGGAVTSLRQAQNLQAQGLDETGVAAQRAGRNLQNVVDSIRDANTAARRGQSDVADYGDAYKRASKEVEGLGRAETALNSLSRNLRGLGLGGAADVLGVGADIAGSVQDLGRIGPTLRDAGTQAATAISNFTGMSVSVGALGVAAGAGVIAIAALTLAFAEWQRQNEEVVKGVRAYISAQQELAGVLPDLTEEERIRRIEELDAAIQANQERVDLLQRSYDQITDGMGVLTTAADILNMRGLQDMRTEMERLRAEILNDNIVLAELRGEVGQTAAAANDAAEAERELAAARLKGENAARQAAITAARNADEAAARATYQANLDAIDSARELARFEAQLSDVRKSARANAGNIREQSRARVDALTEQMTQAEAAAEKAIAKVQADAAKKRQEAERDYMQEALEATRDYLSKEREAQDDYNRERVRRVEDLYDDLLGAEEDNDVIRFIQIKRAGEKDLRRMDEDAAVAERRRSEEYQAEQAQRDAEQEQRLADLQDDSAERIAEIRAGLREQRAQYEEQVRQEQAAMKERLRLNQQGLIAELDTRRKAHAISLQEEAVYAQRRLALEQQLNAALLAIARQSYSGAAIKSTGYSTLTATKALATSGRTLTTTSAVSPVFNISMGNIGSNLSRTEVSASITSAVKASYAATLSAMTGGK